MTHTVHNFYQTKMRLQTMQELLVEQNDNKAEVLNIIQKSIKEIEKHIQQSFTDERTLENEQTGYFENIKIKYSVKYFGSDEVDSVIEREFKDYCVDMKTIKGLIKNERELHNKNECYLSAEIYLTDLDCEDEE